MKCEMINNNEVTLAGVISSPFKFRNVYGMKCYYTAELKVERLSGNEDTIIIAVADDLVNVSQNYTGKRVCIKGYYSSHSEHSEGRSHLHLFVHCTKFELQTSEYYYEQNINEVYLNGFICKTPIYRETPLGREITDIFVAVNRAYGVSDYIPCICWGETARKAAELKVGTNVELLGRAQSRKYLKRYENGTSEMKVAYEISVFTMRSYPAVEKSGMMVMDDVQHSCRDINVCSAVMEAALAC